MSRFAVNLHAHPWAAGNEVPDSSAAFAECSPAQDVPQLILRFRPLLLSGPKSGHVDLLDAQGRTLTLAWLPAGHTAGTLFFVRRYAIEAACAFISGLDDREDARAISMARGVMPQATNPAIQEFPRCISLHADAEISTDSLIAAATTAWSAVFFGMLGLRGMPLAATGQS